MDYATQIRQALENKGFLKFKGPDQKAHNAVVSNGLIIIDDTEKMTWDTFTYLYMQGLPYTTAE